MEQDIVVIYKEPKKNVEYLKMKNSDENFKRKLNGEIEKIDLGDSYIICKKDNENLLPNVYVRPTGTSLIKTIKGNLFYVAKDMETGNISSFRRDNVLKYGEVLNKNSHDYSNQDEDGSFISKQDQRKSVVKKYNKVKKDEISSKEESKTGRDGFFVIDLGKDEDANIPEEKKNKVTLSPKDENYFKAMIFLLNQINNKLGKL